MSLGSESKQGEHMDRYDRLILRELQQDARLSFSEIGRRVSLSQPTVAERVRRMEEVGIIRGYHVDVDPKKIGLALTAFIRLKIPHPTPRQKKLEHLIETELVEIRESHRVTGDHSLFLKAQVGSMVELDALLNKLSAYGQSYTSIVLTTTFERQNCQV